MVPGGPGETGYNTNLTLFQLERKSLWGSDVSTNVIYINPSFNNLIICTIPAAGIHIYDPVILLLSNLQTMYAYELTQQEMLQT